MAQIVAIKGREILDSRGNPTVEAEVTLSSGTMASASVPSGASTGALEALELRDQDKNRYLGKGVLQAVKNINEEIQPVLLGLDVTQQSQLDHIMIDLDGTDNKGRLGANAILAVSLALARAAAIDMGMPLFRYLAWAPGAPMSMPVPLMNIINGGAHANNRLDIQEFMVVPFGFKSFSNALRCGTEIFHHLKEILKQKNFSVAVGDEGGFAPNIQSHEEAIELILLAIQRAGYTVGDQVSLALDVAASEFYKDDGRYELESANQSFDREQWLHYLNQLVKQYPIISIEDGMGENDWEGWKLLTTELGQKIQLVGDDLFVTNNRLLQKGIDGGIANAILIKLNQIGTLTETMDTIRLAKDFGYAAIISHRSGETTDDFIADLAVGMAVGQIKTGSLCRTDRVAKYNQLLRIESEMQSHIPFAGRKAFSLLKNEVNA